LVRAVIDFLKSPLPKMAQQVLKREFKTLCGRHHNPLRLGWWWGGGYSEECVIKHCHQDGIFVKILEAGENRMYLNLQNCHCCEGAAPNPPKWERDWAGGVREAPNTSCEGPASRRVADGGMGTEQERGKGRGAGDSVRRLQKAYPLSQALHDEGQLAPDGGLEGASLGEMVQ